MKEAHPELLKVLLDSAIPLQGDDGEPLSAGKFFEIFIGLEPLPACFDWFIEDQEATFLSAALAEFLCNGMTWRKCRDQVMQAYPVTKRLRRDRFAAVMAGLRDYTAAELDGELLDLHETYRSLRGHEIGGADRFLKDLRSRALLLRN